MKTAREIFREVWIDEFGHSKELDEQLEISMKHDYLFDAMEKYADQFKITQALEQLKKDCLEAQKKYEDCWEDQPFDEEDEKFTCTRCGGFLYIEQGGDTVDCYACNGTGVERPERVFNAQKFGEWVCENPFFYFDENEEDYNIDVNIDIEDEFDNLFNTNDEHI